PSVALILVIASAGGLLTRHSAPQSVAVNGSPSPDVGSVPQRQAGDALPEPVVNDKGPASRKTGALTGLVVDVQSKPVVGANVWGGYSSKPFAQDTTDESGQFALDKVAAPSFVTVAADGFAADQQEFDPINVPGLLVFRLTPVRPLAVRLLDESGQGVGGVRLFLQQWWGRAG